MDTFSETPKKKNFTELLEADIVQSETLVDKKKLALEFMKANPGFVTAMELFGGRI